MGWGVTRQVGLGRGFCHISGRPDLLRLLQLLRLLRLLWLRLLLLLDLLGSGGRLSLCLGRGLRLGCGMWWDI